VIGWAADMALTTSVDYYSDAVARVFSPQLVPLSGELTLGTGTPVLLPLPPQPPAPIRGQVIDAEGVARSAPSFQVNRRVPGQRVTPRIVWLSAAGGGSGGFLTIWEDESGQDGQGGGVFGHLLDASGTPYGGDFLVNVTTAGNQVGPQLAAGPHGAVAVWQDGTTTNIYARLIAVP
jgi:hypothetical protein